MVFPMSYPREMSPTVMRKAEDRHTHMVHRSPATASSYEGNVGAMQLRKVHFFPGILVSTYNDAWPVAVDEQDWLVSWFLLEQPATEFSSALDGKMGRHVPILEGEVEIRVTGLRDVDTVICDQRKRLRS